MTRSEPGTEKARARAGALAGLLAANVFLALGPWLVRLADTGPVAAGFWRLSLAFPVIALLALREGGASAALSRTERWIVLGAGAAFALDLAAWHIGIRMTRLGNASVLGNSGSVILMAFGLIVAARRPRLVELAVILAALGGTALLLGGSLQISRENLVGDLFCLAAGGLYALYILLLRPARARLGQNTLLAVSMLAGIPVLLATSLALGERIVPHDWTPLVTLAFTSQVMGQGLLIYSLRHFSPLVIGLALLTQPAISVTIGWIAFAETLGPADVLGMALLAGAMIIARNFQSSGRT